MTLQANEILTTVARELQLSEDDLVRQGLRSVLERQVREVKAEIFTLHGQYGVSSVEEMEARYQDGSIEEADSWRAFQRLDHLEAKRDRLLKLLGDVA
jgi:aminoglycoside phosphotransferase (APT) family kinase protein